MKTNKKSNLEEKTGIKEYSFREFIIPFSHLGTDFPTKYGTSSLKGKILSYANLIWSYGSLILISGYLVNASATNSLNPQKWPEIREQQGQEQTIERQNLYRNQFHNLDKNSDSTIDSMEFIYRE